MNRQEFPLLGYGVGLRTAHYRDVLESNPRVDWFEVITENFMAPGGRPLHVLEQVRERYPIVFHGVSMSLGSTDTLNTNYLRRLATMARRFQPAWVSDHLCWTGVGGRNLHDLVPLPHTGETVRHVARRIRQVQETLERTILIENISSYFRYRQSEMSEAQFLSAVAEEADCAILLDINNIFVNSYNHRFDAEAYLEALDPRRIAQFHLAGHQDHGSYLLDSHDRPIRSEVWSLYQRAVARFGQVSALIEWDDAIPSLDELIAIADEARHRGQSVHVAANMAPPAYPQT
jgi:uncharacterized protein